MDKSLKVFSKAIGYVTILVVYLTVLFRGLLPYLWGSRLDLVVLSTPFVGVLGFVLFIYISAKLYNDLRNTK
jgi:hypothetical protein